MLTTSRHARHNPRTPPLYWFLLLDKLNSEGQPTGKASKLAVIRPGDPALQKYPRLHPESAGGLYVVPVF